MTLAAMMTKSTPAALKFEMATDIRCLPVLRRDQHGEDLVVVHPADAGRLRRRRVGGCDGPVHRHDGSPVDAAAGVDVGDEGVVAGSLVADVEVEPEVRRHADVEDA